jgi:hypothetical protein
MTATGHVLMSLDNQRRQKRLQKVTLRVAVPTSAVGLMFVPLAGAGGGNHSFTHLSAAVSAEFGAPDLPHIPESSGTYDSPFVAAGTARVDLLVGPLPSEIWDGSARYGPYGPNIFGD